MSVRKDLFGKGTVKRSELAFNGKCAYGPVRIPGCKYCDNPYLKEYDEQGMELMHGHKCPNTVEYACTMKDQSGNFFMCGGMTALPLGFCKEHAILHGKQSHGVHSTRLDQQVRLFAIVVD